MKLQRIEDIAANVSQLISGTLDHDDDCAPGVDCEHWRYSEMSELIACALEVELEECS